MLPIVTVSENVSKENVESAIFEILDSFRFSVTENDFLVIKPNLCDFRPPEQGSTTDPLVIEAIIKYVRKQTSCPIAIVESDHSLATADEEFERMGYEYLRNQFENVELINLTNDNKHRLEINGHYFKELSISETLLKMTKYINVAKLKTHTQHRITCILKNQFGLIARRSKKRYHPFLNEVMLDLIELFPPNISIIEGITSMEGSGPSDGDKLETNLIISGTEPIVTDCVAAQIMGIKPKSVPVIRTAKKKGLSKLEYELKGSIPKFHFKHIPWYSFIIRRWGFRIHKRASKKYERKKDRAAFLSDVAAGFIVLRQGKYSTLQSGLIDRAIFWRVVKGMLKRPFVLIKLKIKGL